MIEFACPSCQSIYRVPDRRAGGKFACHNCGQRVQVPAPPARGLSGPDTDGRRAELSPGSGRSWLPVLAGGFAALALVAGVLLALSAGPTSPTEPSLPVFVPGPGEPVTSAAVTPGPAELAPKAYKVLKEHCYRCHGENGSAEGGLNFVLDRDKLVARRKIIPGDAGGSKLYRRVIEGEMPPPEDGGPLGPADAGLLRQWIEAGAPGATAHVQAPQFLADARVLSLIGADLRSLPERDRRFTRYFTLTHLYNSGLSDDELQTYRHALAKLVNSLSWHRQIARPQSVDVARTVFRVDIRDYLWSDRVWQRVLDVYPYGLLPDTPEATACIEMTDGQLPYVRADWFIATATRPPLYHDVLQLPDTERRLEEQLHIDLGQNIRQERVARAGFNGSGVSQNNRLIERHESPYGSYWRSYDFSDNVGRRNLFAHPLGPGPEASAFDADGGEAIFSLPNGLHAYLLLDREGRRLDRAPLAIVSDPRRPDRAVENGISCMTCHVRGLIDKSDQVRAHVERNPNAFSPAEADTIKVLYPPAATTRVLLASDNERFRKAVEQTGSRLGATEQIAALVLQYEKELDARTAAAELGLPENELLARLDESAALSRTLGSLRVPGGTVQRQVFIQAFPDLVRELNLGRYVPPKPSGRD